MSCALGFALAAAPAFAFKLEAWGSAHPEPPKGADRQTLGFMRLFNQDVHERITRRVYDLAGEKAPEDVVAGVRWNDNPPALQASALFGGCMGRQLALGEGMRCWTGMFRVDRLALEVLTKREKTLEPVRSHFGDMQFLHAMAVRAGEPAARTRLNILRWSEFAYRAARGEIEPGANIFEMKRVETSLEKETAQWLAGLFQGPSKQLWTLEDMFLPKSKSLRLMAFGSLLHVVEDSYSASHVKRQTNRVQPNGCPSYDAADPIVQFRTFVGQDTEKHGVCDDTPDWLTTPRPGGPTEVMAEIVRAYRDGREWPVVRAILEDKVFRLADSVSDAQPGDCFEWRFTEAVATASHEPVVSLESACH